MLYTIIQKTAELCKEWARSLTDFINRNSDWNEDIIKNQEDFKKN